MYSGLLIYFINLFIVGQWFIFLQNVHFHDTCLPNFNFCVIFDLHHFRSMKLGKESISNWCEVR